MEKYRIDKDIEVVYVTASSFPAGIKDAFAQLGSLPNCEERTYYGISYPDANGIVYKAAVEEAFPGEGANYNLGTFTIKKGEYESELLKDWMRDETIIGKTFEKLLEHPDLDREGYCLEIYINDKDVRCLVPLN